MCTIKFCNETAQSSVITYESEQEAAFKAVITEDCEHAFGQGRLFFGRDTSNDYDEDSSCEPTNAGRGDTEEGRDGGGGEPTSPPATTPYTRVLSLAIHACVANDELLYLLEHAFRIRPVNLQLNTKWHLKSAQYHTLFNDVKQFTLLTPFVKRVASFLASLPPGGELILPHFGLRATNSAVAPLDAAKADINMFDRIVLGECKPNTPPASALHVFLCIAKELEIEHKAISTVPNDGTGRH